MRAFPSKAAYYPSMLSPELPLSIVLCMGCRVLLLACPLLLSICQCDWTLLRLPLALSVRIRVPRLRPLKTGCLSSGCESALANCCRLASDFFLLLALWPSTARSILSYCCPYYWFTRSIIKCLNSLFYWEALLFSLAFISA